MLVSPLQLLSISDTTVTVRQSEPKLTSVCKELEFADQAISLSFS
jgi:hypothetical protein